MEEPDTTPASPPVVSPAAKRPSCQAVYECVPVDLDESSPAITEDVRPALSFLPQKEKIFTEKVYLQGMSPEEAGKSLGMSANASRRFQTSVNLRLRELLHAS